MGFYSTRSSHDQPFESHDYTLSSLSRSHDHSVMSRDISTRSHDPLLLMSNLGGCVIVTSTCVYQCRQKRSPEALFNELALNPKTRDKAEEFGITYKLDICGLYKVSILCPCIITSLVYYRISFVFSNYQLLTVKKKVAWEQG